MPENTLKAGSIISPATIYETNIREFIRHLENCRQLLAKLSLKQSRLQLKNEELPIKQVRIEANIKAGIITAQDKEGKPTFPNETARKSALEMALTANEKYQQNEALYRRGKSQLLNLRAEFEILVAEIKKYEGLQRLNEILLEAYNANRSK